MSKIKVHIIEDEEDISDLLEYNLKNDGFEVSSSSTGQKGLVDVFESKPDILLLDLMLPEMSGIDICRAIRSAPQHKKLPIIMITAKGCDEDIIKGLEVGADDYIVKPFSPKIVTARVNTVLRRVKNASKTDDVDVEKIEIFELAIHKGRFEIFAGSEKVDLTYSEFHILWNLAKRPGWVFTRSQLVDIIRGEDHAITDRAIDVQIVGLRKKLGEFGKYIETVRGLGYRFKEP